MNKELKNILIVRTDRIGDLVLTLPLAGLIKKQYPNSKVSFLVREYTKNIVGNHPFVDEVLVLKEVNGIASLFSNINLIKQKNFDSCIVVYPRFKISLIVFLSRIKNRIGTGYRWYSFLFNQKVFEHRKNAERHELEYNVNLLEKLGIKNTFTDSNIRYDLKVDEHSLQNVIKVLLDENPLMNKSYNAWIELLKFESEILSENYTEAKRTAIGVNRMTYTANQDWVKLFTVEDFKYMMAFMKFKQKQYQSCINQIEILEAGFPKSIRLKMLKLDAYKALNNAEKANEIELILNQTNN